MSGTFQRKTVLSGDLRKIDLLRETSVEHFWFRTRFIYGIVAKSAQGANSMNFGTAT